MFQHCQFPTKCPLANSKLGLGARHGQNVLPCCLLLLLLLVANPGQLIQPNYKKLGINPETLSGRLSFWETKNKQ